jgi:hypothetical protein
MGESANMSLDKLIGLTLEIIQPDPVTSGRLRTAAQRSLQDSQLTGISPENSFDLAYKAIMQSANRALHVNGFRTLTSKPGHHQTMIQTLPQTIGLGSKTMVILDGLRKQRNVIDYSGDVVSASMVAEAIKYASELFLLVDAWIAKNKPDRLE